MECECGSARMADASAKRSKAGVELSYRVCATCGRNEYVALLVHGQIVARGVDAQRQFLAMEEGGKPAPESLPAPAVVESVEWTPVSTRPSGAGLVRVRFITGGYFVERPSYFDERWDLIEAWHPYDNTQALAASLITPPIPVALRVGEPTPEPKRQARPIPPPPPQEVPRGATLSLF